MSDNENILKNPEEEQKALTEKHDPVENTAVTAEPDEDLNETTAVMSEAKVRHDTVK